MQLSNRFRLAIPFCLAIFFGIYFYFFAQNFPYEIDEVLPSYGLLKDVSYSELLARAFSPTSFSTFSGALYEYIFVRVTECFLYKDILQDHMWRIFYYNMTLTILLVLMVYRLSLRFIQSTLGASLCIIFLLTTPAYGWSLYELGESSPADQVFLLIYFRFLIRQFQRIRTSSAYSIDVKQILRFVILWIIGMLTIRVKNTNLVVVPLLTTLLVLFYPGFNMFVSQKRKRLGLLMILLIGIYCGLPALIAERNPPDTLISRFFDLKNLYYIFIQNPFGWEAEKLPVLFRLNRQLPTSLLAQFGFFLAWTLVLGSGIVFWTKKPAPEKGPAFSYGFFVSIWIVSSSVIYIFGGWLIFTRHMIYLLLPTVVGAFYILFNFVRRTPNKFHKAATVFIVVAVLFQIGDNFRHALYLREQHEKLWGSKWAFRKAIYKERTGHEPSRMFDLTNYWFPWPKDLWDISVYLDARSRVPDFSSGSDFSNLVDRYNTIYLATHEELTDTPWQEILILKLNPAHFSSLSKFVERFKNAQETYYLYRIEK